MSENTRNELPASIKRNNPYKVLTPNQPQVPFGGVKASGYGRFGGMSSIAEFTVTRWITIEDPRQPYPF